MKTHDLKHALVAAVESHAIPLGIFSHDQLASLIVQNYPSCLIVNTDPSKHPGAHWCAYYFDTAFNVEFFDSLGHTPSFYQFRLSAHTHNTLKLQSNFSSNCGAFCLFYLYFRSRAIPLGEIQSMFFKGSQGCLTNDKKVTRFTRHILQVD